MSGDGQSSGTLSAEAIAGRSIGLRGVDDLLRGRRQIVGASEPGGFLWLIAVIAVFGAAYGVVMGTFGGLRGEQMLYSAVKVPLLLGTTFTLSIPSFFVIATILGLRDDFRDAVRALVATQAVLAVILAAFSPFTAVWYASSSDYDAAKIFNILMFAAASLTAQVVLRRFARPLLDRDRRHALLLGGWLVMYSFVGVQMGWVLRPFIGQPHAETTFFRDSAWSNAYVEVGTTIWRVVQGG